MLKLKKIKKRTKKWPKSTRFNLPNLRIESWDWDNLIESKLKQIMKLNCQSTLLKNESEKNIWLKKDIKKWLEST